MTRFLLGCFLAGSIAKAKSEKPSSARWLLATSPLSALASRQEELKGRVSCSGFRGRSAAQTWVPTPARSSRPGQLPPVPLSALSVPA